MYNYILCTCRYIENIILYNINNILKYTLANIRAHRHLSLVNTLIITEENHRYKSTERSA